MSKSVLVIDTPSSCKECKLRYDNYGYCEVCILLNDDIEYFCVTKTKPTYCPLSPLPEKKELTHYIQRGDAKSMTHMMMSIHDQGWNDCIDEILGEN